MQPIHGMEVDNLIGDVNQEGNLPVLPPGKVMNPTDEDMAILRCIGITIDANAT